MPPNLSMLDVLVNNAAVKSDYNQTMNVNVKVPYLLMKKVMKDCKIINVASESAIRGQSGLAEYSASKHALVGLSKSLREEGRDINIIYPSRVDTNFNINKGGLNPKDVADAIYFIATRPSNVSIDLFISER